MSWFKRRPHVKEPQQVKHRRHSHLTDKLLDEAKEKHGPSKDIKKQDKSK